MPLPLCRSLAFCLLFACLGAVLAKESGELGLVKEQPASGRFVKTERGYMVPYEATIPGTDVTFQMQPIPGGKFLLGSPETEKGRKADEGPQIEVEVDPFWMATHEVTWAEYKSYMAMYEIFKRLDGEGLAPIADENRDYVVTAPSSLYDPTFTFKLGSEPNQPAVTMSQYAAKQYTKWLSGLTGHFYRLPSEAEWEYACRAGTTTAFSFGDNPALLDEYGWHYDNAGEKMQPVGQKKPNPWGLYDMHGNVGEWVLDQYSKDGYQHLADKKSVTWQEALNWPKRLYPRVIRGGGWDETASSLRSAARRKSDDDSWREEDPNFPQSPWWFTSEPALSVGFRFIRPLHVPPVAERKRFWDADIAQIQEDVDHRIDNEGRGSRAPATPALTDAIQKLPKQSDE